MTTTSAPPTTSTLVTQGARRGGQARSRRRVEPIYFWFLVPTVILFTLAITVPAVIGIFFSFTNSIGLGDWQFIGLTNYIALFSDPLVVQS
jgi:raffinose/stachyose/melibiose transport system permease protein